MHWHRTGSSFGVIPMPLLALTQFPSGGKNCQMHAHVEPIRPCSAFSVQNKLSEQVGPARLALMAVGGEQFQFQLASGALEVRPSLSGQYAGRER